MPKKVPKPPLVVRGAETKWEMALNVKSVTAAIGIDTLANFYRCFAAADRLVALEHLVVLNRVHLSRDCIASERNMHHLFLLLASAMYEAGDALQILTSTKFGATLKGLKTWMPLTKMRKEWNKNEFAGKIRNNFGHHFGETNDYIAGITKGRRRVVLETGEGGLLMDSRTVAPMNALFAGLHITNRKMKTFVRKTRDAHTKYSSLVRLLFQEALVAHGLLPAQ
jgi:hypothetical protein